MADQIQSLLANVRCYAERRGESLLDLESPIGYGTDGIVWKTATTAIKAFYRQRNFLNELSCYERLKQRNAPDAIQGFWVPRLVGHDHKLMLVEMQLVRPPYLIDFGKAYLDLRPAHVPPVSLAELQDWFEDRTPVVLALLRTLWLSYGIYYLDPRPGNIMFGDEHLD